MRGFVIMLLTCSATMSALGLVYMALTPMLTKHYSEKGRYYAWLIIVIGLIIPFRPHFASAIVTVDMPSEAVTPIAQTNNPITVVMPRDVAALPAAAPSFTVWQIAVVVWLMGMIIFIAYHAIKHHKFSKMAARWSEPVTDERILDLLCELKSEMGISGQVGLCSCPSVGGPTLLGFVSSRILLPQTDFAPEELRFILKHELNHYKCKDLYYKVLVLIATAIHWFNPIVYLMAKAIDAACELSCDADTVRGTDAEARQRYSKTIIGVVRFQSNLKTALSTNFYGGKRGMKNRISSIMNTGKRKTGTAILCCTLILTLGTGMTFAAQTPPASGPSADTDYAQLDIIHVVEDTFRSYFDPTTGKTMYSWDSGKTWTALTDDEFDAMDPTSVIEWWTYDEYKVWMEEQIAGLQAIADDGIPDYYDKNDVLRDFTQADVDEFAANCQTTLESIKNGTKVSKSVNGLTGVIISYDPREVATINESDIANNTTYAIDSNSWSENDAEQNYDEYVQLGITYRNKKLYYNGEPVRCFDDWYSCGEGMYAGRSYFDKDGMMDVYAERDFSNIVYNPDGSYDPSGKLVGVRASSQAEFDARDLSQYTQPVTPSVTTDIETQSPAYSISATDTLSPVATDNTYTMNASSSGGTHTGRTIAEIFEDYAAFGVTFNTKSVNGGPGNIYYDGKLVKQFIDLVPDGGVFSCSSSDGGTISLRTVYDASGKITGVEVVGA